MKKGQITVFIVIGIAVLAIVGVLLYMRGPDLESEKSQTVPIEAQPVADFVEECIETVGRHGLATMGLQGGYAILEGVEHDARLNMPYYYNEERIAVPEKQVLETQLSAYYMFNLPFCLEGLERLPGYSVSANKEIADVTTRFNDGKVFVTLEQGVKIDQRGSVLELSRFDAVIEGSRLEQEHAMAKRIIDDYVENDGQICISCVLEWSSREGMVVEIFDIDERETMITVVIADEKPGDERFRFGIRKLAYDCANPPPVADYEYSINCNFQEAGFEEVSIGPIDPFDCEIGVPCEKEIVINGDYSMISDNSNLFDISVTDPKISFTPEKAGTHLIRLEVFDARGKSDIELFTITVS